MDYSKLVERLKCPKVRECPYDYANSCKVCQKELHRDTITAITELIARAEAAEAEIEQLRNEHVKIQYNGEELTVQELCERLERAEKKSLDGWNTIDSLYGMCGQYCDDKISEYFHRWP